MKKTQVIPHNPAPVNQAPPSPRGGCILWLVIGIVALSIAFFSLGAGAASRGGMNFEPRAFSDNITATTGEGGQAVAIGRGAGDITVTDSRSERPSGGNEVFNLLVFGALFVGGGYFLWSWSQRGNYG